MKPNHISKKTLKTWGFVDKDNNNRNSKNEKND